MVDFCRFGFNQKTQENQLTLENALQQDSEYVNCAFIMSLTPRVVYVIF